MNLQDIARLRLASQQIAGTAFTSPRDLVAWMGAMQAQDYAMVKWAVGLRVAGATDLSVEEAIHRGEILRTHVMRPTWHLVAADDIYWMLELTAPNIKKTMKSRRRELGLTETVLSKSRKVLEKALRDGRHATREELIPLLNKAGIPTTENRASHIFVAAELDGLICSGAVRSGKQTFGLLNERVPATPPLAREAALALLAERYFTSHGPATLEDFAWWSGLSAGDSKDALELTKPQLLSEVVEERIYWFAEWKIETKNTVFLLPAFDEFIISYRDRRAVITSENHKRAVSVNGMFHPTVVANGEALGIWKRTMKKDTVKLVFEYFAQPNDIIRRRVASASLAYGRFLGTVVA